MSQFQLTLPDVEARNIATDRATVNTRIESFRKREPVNDDKLIIPVGAQVPTPDSHDIPEVAAGAFDAAKLREALAQHGALIVRNFFDRTSMETLVHCANNVIDACEDPNAEDKVKASAYFNPPGNLRSIMPNKDRELGNTRNFHRESGSAMCIEAPSVAESLLRLYDAYGLKDLLTEYLGEKPCLSVKKWVLRRSRLPVAEAGWHQDGAFMGSHINSVNMWIPLNECGGDTGAPGMDLVPLRLNDIASAEGAQFDWSVSDSHVSGSYRGTGLVAPVFNAGDAFFFDHFYLHRTQYRTDFSKVRYAVETWFFGESHFPKNQIPLAW